MPVHVVCPECGATTTLDDDSSRKVIACRQCGKEVPVPGSKQAGPPPLPAGGGPPPLPPLPKKEAAPDTDGGFEVLEDVGDEEPEERPRRPRDRDEDESGEHVRPAARRRDDDDEEEADRPRRPRAGRDEDEEDEDRPRRPAARDRDDEEDEAPRRPAAARGRDEDEDEEEDRPRSRTAVRDEDEDDDSIPRRRPGDGDRRPPKKSKAGLILVGLFAFLLLGAGGGVAAYLFFWKDEEQKVAQGDGNNPPPDSGQPGPKPPDPKPPDVKAPDPKTPDPKVPDPKAPEVRGLAIGPVQFDGDRKGVALAGKVADVCAGGDGRFLFLHCPDDKKLFVFDVPAASVVKELPTGGKDTRMAAGAAKLLLIDNAARTVRRYDLLTLEKDKDGPLPFEGTVQDVALGSGSHGPALLVTTAPADRWPVHFLDVNTLGRADVGWVAPPPADLPRELRFRASANGARWAGVPTGPNAKGLVIVSREGKRLTAERYGPDRDFGYAALSADGNYVYSRAGPALVHQSLGAGGPRPDSPVTHVPAVCSHLEVRLDPPGPGGTVKATVTTRAKSSLSASADSVPPPFRPDDALTPDRLLHYVPDAKALVIVTADRSHLEVVKLDPMTPQAKPGVLFTSTPPDTFTPGQTFAWQARVITAGPPVTFRKAAGPPGARVYPNGVVQWDVPADEAAEQATVVISVQVEDARFPPTIPVRLHNALAPAPKSPEPKPKDPMKSPDPKTPAVAENIAPGAKLVQEAAGKLPVTPPEMSADKLDVALPSPVRDACVAGGGRYLVFDCPAARRLVVFDVNTLKLEKRIELVTDDFLFAAGMEKLLVVYPAENVVHRYSLATLKFEAELALNVKQRPTAAGMGSATVGPLILGGIPAQNNASKMTLTFIDLENMKEVKIDKAEGDFTVRFGSAAQLRVSADGRTLGAWFTQLVPSGLQVARLDGNTIGGSYKPESVGHVTPGPDGQTIFTEKGMYTAKGEPTGKRDPAVPAVHGNWYLTLPANPKGPAGAKVVTVWEAGKDAPLAEFADVPGFDGKRDPFERDNPSLALDRRLYLVPEAKILVAVPPAANKLHVFRVGPAKK